MYAEPEGDEGLVGWVAPFTHTPCGPHVGLRSPGTPWASRCLGFLFCSPHSAVGQSDRQSALITRCVSQGPAFGHNAHGSVAGRPRGRAHPLPGSWRLEKPEFEPSQALLQGASPRYPGAPVCTQGLGRPLLGHPPSGMTRRQESQRAQDRPVTTLEGWPGRPPWGGQAARPHCPSQTVVSSSGKLYGKGTSTCVAAEGPEGRRS